MKKSKNEKVNERGFVALVSTLIISAVLMSIVIGAGAAGWYARLDALGSESKRIALSLAESCASVALTALATSTDPTHLVIVNQSVHIGADSLGNPLTCTIVNIAHNGTDATINTHAEFNNSYSAVEVIASIFDTTKAPTPPGTDSVAVKSWRVVGGP
jgi:hypothetical protein